MKSATKRYENLCEEANKAQGEGLYVAYIDMLRFAHDVAHALWRPEVKPEAIALSQRATEKAQEIRHQYTQWREG